VTRPRILVVEDDVVVGMLLAQQLVRLGYDVAAVIPTGEEAVEQALDSSPDLVLMDIGLEGKIDGIEAASRIRSALGLPIVYVTASVDDDLLERARMTEPVGYLAKPYGEPQLRSTMETALHKAQERRQT
jgi:CheY-like chemotaxis protein